MVLLFTGRASGAGAAFASGAGRSGKIGTAFEGKG